MCSFTHIIMFGHVLHPQCQETPNYWWCIWTVITLQHLYFVLCCFTSFSHCLCSSTALCFTCAWYSSIVTGGLLHLLVVQVINVSYNVTEREARVALREKTARSAYCGLVVDTGVYSRGFRGNWAEFMTMGEKMNLPSPAPTDLV